MSEKIGAVPVIILPDEVQKIRGAEIKRLRVQCPERLGLAFTHEQLDYRDSIIFQAGMAYMADKGPNLLDFKIALEGLC